MKGNDGISETLIINKTNEKMPNRHHVVRKRRTTVQVDREQGHEN